MVLLSLLYLACLVVLPGIGVAHAMSLLNKKPFTLPEFLSIASAASLFVVPGIALISIKTLPYQFAAVPLYGVSFASLMLIAMYQNKKKIQIQYTLQDSIVFFSCLAIGAVIIALTHAYYPLPDLDPYYWIDTYNKFLASFQSGVYINSYRPGFFAFVFTWNNISHIDLYALFKYVLPLLYLAPLFPIWMVARTMKTIASAAVIATFLLWSSSTILYATTPMPQVLYILALSYSMLFLVYARISGQTLYRYIAGGVLALCIPMYESAAIPFLLWGIITLYHIRKSLIQNILRNPIAIVLFFMLVVTNISSGTKQITFVAYWIHRVIQQTLHAVPNFAFPASYINVDGNQVGWSGIEGVLKYYMYYAGPVAIYLFLIGIWALFRRDSRSRILREIRTSPETQIAAAIFGLFFCITEVLPRVISLALLPDRAWISEEIILVYPVVLLLRHLHVSKEKIVASLFLFLTIISTFGALYINYQKRFLIPLYQLNSASWITANLPADRIIIADANTNLLRFHAASRILAVSPLYCQEKYSDSKTLLAELPPLENIPQKSQIIDQFLEHIRQYIATHQNITSSDIASIASQYSSQLNSTQDNAVLHPYIYYYADDPDNPYLRRPYMKQRETCDPFIFDKHPDQYKRVYEDDKRVIIWQVL